MPKNCVGNLSLFHRISGIEKIQGEEGGPRIPVEIFLSHSAEKFLNVTRLCFTNFPLSKNVMDKRGCGSRFSVENFFVSQCRKKS